MIRTPSTMLRTTLVGSCVLALLVTAACRSHIELPPGADNPDLVDGEVGSVNPLDIAVLPVENLTERGDLPLDVLRSEFHKGLVARRYSPLALEYVDGKIVEASYTPGSSNEHGLLKVQITGWDDSNWRTHSRLIVDADVWLLDPENPVPTRALWGGHVQRRLEMAFDARVTATDEALTTKTMREFATSVLASLPPRNPEIATAR